MIERGVSEKVLLFLNLLGSICIFPFAILRWHYGDITLAIVDGIISITLLVFFFVHIYNPKNSCCKNFKCHFFSYCTPYKYSNERTITNSLGSPCHYRNPLFSARKTGKNHQHNTVVYNANHCLPTYKLD